MNMKPAIVLRQMIKGREVELSDWRFRIKDGKLEYQHKETNDVWIEDETTVNDFMDECLKLSDSHISTKIIEEIQVWEKQSEKTDL